jgi:hypothetical protein
MAILAIVVSVLGKNDKRGVHPVYLAIVATVAIVGANVVAHPENFDIPCHRLIIAVHY